MYPRGARRRTPGGSRAFHPVKRSMTRITARPSRTPAAPIERQLLAYSAAAAVLAGAPAAEAFRASKTLTLAR